MSDSDQPLSSSDTPEDPAERLVQHLLRQPHDLVDARRLFQRFRVTTREFQRALRQFEDLRPTGDIPPQPA